MTAILFGKALKQHLGGGYSRVTGLIWEITGNPAWIFKLVWMYALCSITKAQLHVKVWHRCFEHTLRASQTEVGHVTRISCLEFKTKIYNLGGL